MILRRYLTPPQFEDNARKTHTAQALYFLLLLTLVTLLISSSYFLFFDSAHFRNVTTIALSFITNITLLIMIRRGQVELAGQAFIAYIWFLPIVLSLLTRGILSPYPTLHIVVILVGGIIVHPRFSILLAFGSIINATILLFISENLPTAPNFIGSTPYATYAMTNWMMYTIAFLTTPVLIMYSWRLINQALDDVRQQERKLAYSNAELKLEITKRNLIESELRQSEQRFRQIFANAPTGMAIINDKARPIVINDALQQMVGFDEVNFFNQSTLNYIHPDEVDDERDLVRRLYQGEIDTYSIERRLLIGDDKELPVLAMVTAVRDDDDKFLYAIAMLDNISERKQAEQDRIHLEVERQRVAFLRDFVSNMTHDLKTPLTTINTSLFLLANDPSPETQKRHQETIKLQTTFLTTMIDDILTIARLDSAPALEFSALDINKLVRRAREQLTTKAEGKNLMMTYDLASDVPSIPASEDDLYRAVVNLVENAINYTPENGIVIVRTFIEDGQVGLEVKDSGIGIDNDELPHIFKRFYRASNARTIKGGTGLGLAIIKQIVELHQGEISVDSTVGDGTTFKIKFPVKN